MSKVCVLERLAHQNHTLVHGPGRVCSLLTINKLYVLAPALTCSLI
jgi:3-methyladenine DNA glycosylase Mpg